MLEDHKQLRKLQLEQYKILQSVNDLCSKYGIEYYLLYGTLHSAGCCAPLEVYPVGL